MALFLYGLGFIGGSLYIKNLNQEDYNYFRISFYEPHMKYKQLKKMKRENDIRFSGDDFGNYLKNVFYCAINYFYYQFSGKEKEFIFLKQQFNFELIRHFEFMNETLKNFEKIQENLSQRIKKENELIETELKGEEDYQRDLNKEIDDKNLENMILMKNNTTDEFMKYQLSQNYYTRKDYDKKILPNIKLDKQTNKLVIATTFEQFRRLWEIKRKENVYENMIPQKKTISISELKNKQYVESVTKKNENELKKIKNSDNNDKDSLNFSGFNGLFDKNK